jgi:hypothetical protein
LWLSLVSECAGSHPMSSIAGGTLIAQVMYMHNFNAPSWVTRCATAVVVSGVSWIAAGCTAQIQPASAVVVTDDEVVEDTAPVNVEVYPHTEYRGATVYYVNGRWGRPRGNRWSYYRNEPAELVRHRSYVQQAPPARPLYARPPGEAERVR